MIALRRFAIDWSMKVAGRKIVGSIRIPGGPVRARSLVEAGGHVLRIGPRQLLDDQEEAGTVVDDAVAHERRSVDDHVGDVLQVAAPRRLARSGPGESRLGRDRDAGRTCGRC